MTMADTTLPVPTSATPPLVVRPIVFDGSLSLHFDLDVDYVYLEATNLPPFDDIPFWASSNPSVARISSVTDDALIANVAIGSSGEAFVTCIGKIRGRKTILSQRVTVGSWRGSSVGVGGLTVREVVSHEPDDQ